MGTVFRKIVTRSLPAGAELLEKDGNTVARWTVRGKTRTAATTIGNDGSRRLVVKSPYFHAKYRDGAGIVQTVATGARTEGGARSVLADLERQAEKVRCGILTPAESHAADAQQQPLAEHVAAFITHKTARGLHAEVIRNTERRLARIARECNFARLSDLNSDAFERWLALQTAEGMSPGNRNEYRKEIVGLGNWCVKSRRLLVNPFATVPRADAKADPRRSRRAMTEDELERLLLVARLRPLAERGRQSIRTAPDAAAGRRKRANWTLQPLTLDDLAAACDLARQRLRGNPAFLAELERRGEERALLYKFLVLTGLRKNELASLTVGQIDLEAAVPSLTLQAGDAKNRQAATLPLRSDLADDLRLWLKTKAADRQAAARNAPAVRFDSAAGKPTRRTTTRTPRPQQADLATLSPTERLLYVPDGLVRILDRDLEAAGIAKRDDRGRTLDVHALRHTCGTWLSKNGVQPRTAQSVLRHSTVELTMNVYTDPRLLDLKAAVEALPSLPLHPVELRQVANGRSVRRSAAPVAPGVAPTVDHGWQKSSKAVNASKTADASNAAGVVAASRFPGTPKTPLTPADNGLTGVETIGIEPTTPALQRQCSPN